MPDDLVYEAKITALKKNWSDWGPKVLDQLNTITKLEWMDQDIRCYIVSGTKSSFSHPLTLKLYDTDEQMFDTFVHELIHRLLNSPFHPEPVRAAREALLARYAQESKTVKNHILLHAIHAELIVNLWGQDRLDRVLGLVWSKDYLRAWEIVKERGRKEVLKEFFNYSA